MMLFGCETVEMVFYEHLPSENFYRDLDVKDPALQPFYVDDILLVVNTKYAPGNQYFVWLGLFSEKENKRVDVLKATISGNGLLKESVLLAVIDIDNPTERSGLLQNAFGTFKLFTLDADWLEQVSDGGNPVKLTVAYRANDQEGVVEFELMRRVERYPVFPT